MTEQTEREATRRPRREITAESDYQWHHAAEARARAALSAKPMHVQARFALRHPFLIPPSILTPQIEDEIGRAMREGYVRPAKRDISSEFAQRAVEFGMKQEPTTPPVTSRALGKHFREKAAEFRARREEDIQHLIDREMTKMTLTRISMKTGWSMQRATNARRDARARLVEEKT